MSNTIVGGHLTVTIGTQQITLTSADFEKRPMTFALPPDKTYTVSLQELDDYLNKQFGIHPIPIQDIKVTTLVITSFSVSSAGFVDIAVNFDFGDGSGWTPFSGFTVKEVGFSVSYALHPVITQITPASAAAGTPVVIQGNDLGKASKVLFGTTDAGAISANTPTSLTVNVPTGIAAGSVDVTVVDPDGPSAAFAFTVN